MMWRSWKTIIQTKGEYEAIKRRMYVRSITLVEVTDQGHIYEIKELAPYDDDPLYYYGEDGRGYNE